MKVKFTEGPAARLVEEVGRVERGETVTVSEECGKRLVSQGWKQVGKAKGKKKSSGGRKKKTAEATSDDSTSTTSSAESSGGDAANGDGGDGSGSSATEENG